MKNPSLSDFIFDSLISTQDSSHLFIKPEDGTAYFNAACHSHPSKIANAAAREFEYTFGVCSGRGAGKKAEALEEMKKETKDLFLDLLRVKRPEEWEVIFTYNCTSAIAMAQSIIAAYIDDNFGRFTVNVHPLSHNSVYLNSLNIADNYGAEWTDIIDPICKDYPSTLDYFSYKNPKSGKTVTEKNHRLVCLPFIDNGIGINHWSEFLLEQTNRKFVGCQKDYEHVILDCAQAGLYLLDQAKVTLLNPKSNGVSIGAAGAACFAAHKFHGEHLGVLVIRKKYLEGIENLFKVYGLTFGGGTISGLDGEGNPEVFNDYRGLESGLQNDAHIIGLGAWLKFLKEKRTQRIDDSLWFKQRSFGQNMTEKTLKIKNYIKRQFSDQLEIIESIPNKYTKHPHNSNNIITMDSLFLSNAEVYQMLQDNGVEVRHGDFCVSYGFNKYGFIDPIRISLDWSTTDKEVSKLLDVLCLVVDKAREIKRKSIIDDL
jgi:selenocysteine lyase/cysteine desulfurase